MKKLGTIAILIWLYFIICWIANLVILLQCDFDGPWKEEIIHAIGLLGQQLVLQFGSNVL